MNKEQKLELLYQKQQEIYNISEKLDEVKI